jgi:ABC-type molybdate transport system substrate-binding protein
VCAAVADPACIMVNRNQGAGTRILIDRLLGDARPEGYWNQPRSHNAVAAAVAQGRADEYYDSALVTARKQRPAVLAFLDSLASHEARAALTEAEFRPV